MYDFLVAIQHFITVTFPDAQYNNSTLPRFPGLAVSAFSKNLTDLTKASAIQF